VSDVALDPTWSIGAMFGGHLAELLARAAIAATHSPLVPVSSSVAFLRPAFPGSARISTSLVRAGRRYSVVSATLETDAGAAATALFTLAPAASLPLGPAVHPASLPAEPVATHGSLTHSVDWRTVTPWTVGAVDGAFESWIRLRDDSFDVGRYLVASDLIGPAIAATGVALPFRIATVSLDVSTVALSESHWLAQSVCVTVNGAEAVASLELRDPAGSLLAVATHRVVILPATDGELPLSVTAFGWGR
jgi:acyl-coenzyme A thioesterase PaaI-like protein